MEGITGQCKQVNTTKFGHAYCTVVARSDILVPETAVQKLETQIRPTAAQNQNPDFISKAIENILQSLLQNHYGRDPTQ